MAGDARAPRRLEIGRLGAPHGLAGEIHVHLFSVDSAIYRAPEVVLVDANGERVLSVESARPAARGALVRFGGVHDRAAIEALRGAQLWVERAVLPPLAPGEYYLVDLAGLAVVGPEGRLGEVLEVIANPSVTSVRVRLEDGRVGELALAPPWLRRVSIEEGTIEVESLDGLIL